MVPMEQFHTSEGAVANMDAREYVSLVGGIGTIAAALALRAHGLMTPVEPARPAQAPVLVRAHDGADPRA